jgi:cytochrome P450
MRGRGEVDVVAEFAAPLPILVISELLGVPRERRAWFRDCALALQEAGSTRGGDTGDPAARFRRAERAASELSAYFLQELADRRDDDRGDLISVLVRAQAEGEDDRLTPAEAVATCVHLLTAGHETTTGLIGKAVLALCAHPGARKELAARPELLPRAVDEFVRYDAPVQMVSRWAREDLVLGGRQVRRGDRLVLVLGAANRDPAGFDRPDTLDLHRDPARHCGFGLGIHYCVGALLARAETEIGLSVLLGALPALRPGAHPAVEARYARDWVFHAPERLVLSTRPDAAAGDPPAPTGRVTGRVTGR